MGAHCKKTNNLGFSLVELIAILAIMALMIGMGSLALSLLTGSEAKQAAEKIGAQLNEAKTGSMSRYSEDLNIVYIPKNLTNKEGGFEWADREGYYAVRQMTTMGVTTSGVTGSGFMPAEVSMGAEHRYLCNSRVNMVLTTASGAAYTVSPTIGDGVGFTFDRATGLYSGVKTGCAIITTSGATQGLISGTDDSSQPQTLAITSGLKTYTITFVADTGKHTIEQ